MQFIPRLLVTLAAFLATVVFATLFTALFLPDFFAVIGSLMSWALAAWMARWLWLRLAEPVTGLLATTVVWALGLGGLGFVLGFFGPMILSPGANQGPMLGIFITGPGGFVLGAVVGMMRWSMQSRQG